LGRERLEADFVVAGQVIEFAYAEALDPVVFIHVAEESHAVQWAEIGVFRFVGAGGSQMQDSRLQATFLIRRHGKKLSQIVLMAI
jgi:hypothetical protein